LAAERSYVYILNPHNLSKKKHLDGGKKTTDERQKARYENQKNISMINWFNYGD
jgi:hypothetical protein